MREARTIGDLKFIDPEHMIRAIEDDIEKEKGRSSAES